MTSNTSDSLLGFYVFIAVGVPFFYGCVEFLLIGMYCLVAWKAGWTKAPPTEPFWKVVTVNYEVLLAEKMVKERSNIEIQLSESCEDGYKNEQDTENGVGACIYYCHEPDLANVDPPAPTKNADGSQEKTEKLVEKEESAVAMVFNNARPLFWKSLGYKIE